MDLFGIGKQLSSQLRVLSLKLLMPLELAAAEARQQTHASISMPNDLS